MALLLGTSGGGVGAHVRALAEGLIAREHRVLVAGPRATEDLFGFTAVGATFAPVPISDRPRPSGDAATMTALRRLLKDADVTHAHGLRAGALAGLAGARPLVVTLHNAPPAGGALATVYRMLERIVARRADLVLGVSPDLLGRMRARGARQVERALVPAPPGPSARRSPEGVRAELGIGRDRVLLLTVARLAPQKGLSTLLDAAARWSGGDAVPLAVVAGEGPLEAELGERVAAERLPVRFIGRSDDVSGLIAAADLFVLPSLWEGQPLVLQEALRAGLPIVATDVGGVRDVVGDAAVLVPPGDPPALAEAVTELLTDPERPGELAAAARRRAVTLPSDADAVEQVLGHYRRLASAGP
ncbi:MAG: glycosyltransferase [Streptosporangiales bacterium]|nr:glycosyltransferase [Streptosporangiales bacterium]